MSTVSSVDFLSPASQLEQLGAGIADFFQSDEFRRVVVSKKDEHGNFKTYKDNKTGEVKNTITYIENALTGELYLDEPMEVIASKCATLAFAIPFFTVGKMIWYAVKTPLEIGAIALQVLAGLVRGECPPLKERGIEMLQTLGNGLFEVVKAPFFGLAAEIAAIYGIFRPLPGRAIIARIEYGWQLGISYKNDCRDRLCFDQPNCWQAFLNDVTGDRAFYVARCFQVRGNVNDPRIVMIRRQAL